MKLEAGDILKERFGKSHLICMLTARPRYTDQDIIISRLAREVAGMFAFHKQLDDEIDTDDYYLHLVRYDGERGSQLFGAFQATHEPYRLPQNIFRASVIRLFEWIVSSGPQINPTGVRIDLEIEPVKDLPVSQMLEYLKFLPDCVHVWQYETKNQMSLLDLYKPVKEVK